MKKLSLVLVVLFFVSIVTYGADFWYSPNPTCIRPISGYTHVGIGTNNPAYALHVQGTIGMTGFRLLTGVNSSYVLTCGSGGVGTWQAIPHRWSKSGSNLYYNSGYVGIGASSPTDKLHVNGTVRMNAFKLTTGAHENYVLTCNGSNGVGTWQAPPSGGSGTCLWDEGSENEIYYNDGGGFSKVGIGIQTPSTLLHVAGYHVQDIGLMELRGADKAYMTLRSWNGSEAGFYFYDNQTKKWIVDYKNDGSRFRFYSNTINEEVMTLSNSGYVGIGTTDPQSKLDVSGTITAEEIEVESDGLPDFVFEDNYKLMSLNKLEKHIKREKSLPGIPTSKEAVKKGVKVGDMQAKLLQKVEELTLYVIELNKEVGDLRKENKELKQKISLLSN